MQNVLTFFIGFREYWSTPRIDRKAINLHNWSNRRIIFRCKIICNASLFMLLLMYRNLLLIWITISNWLVNEQTSGKWVLSLIHSNNTWKVSLFGVVLISIQSECGKIRSRKNSEYGHFLRSESSRRSHFY